jgi:hypothetical protein
LTGIADSPNGRTDAELSREALSELYRPHASTVHGTEANLALLSIRRQHRRAAVKPGITVEGFDGPKK